MSMAFLYSSDISHITIHLPALYNPCKPGFSLLLVISLRKPQKASPRPVISSSYYDAVNYAIRILRISPTNGWWSCRPLIDFCEVSTDYIVQMNNLDSNF